MLVRQDLQAEPLELPAPAAHIPIVLVVSGHEVRPVRRPEPAQGRDMLPQLRNKAVRDVAGDCDEIRMQRVGSIHHRVHKRTPDRGADVQIAELENAETGQVAGEIDNRHGDANHARPPSKHNTHEREDCGCTQHCQDESGGVTQPQEIDDEERHDQERRQAHRCVRGPFEAPDGAPPAAGEHGHER